MRGVECLSYVDAWAVVEAAAAPTLPASMRLVGEAVRVKFCEADDRGVKLSFSTDQVDRLQMSGFDGSATISGNLSDSCD